jgi:orotidine-5'-phosphate decarboxylase
MWHLHLKPEERLIVAADFIPQNGEGRSWVRKQVLDLADKLADTGVVIKVNSALRACGYDLIDELHARELKVFADLKLFDIKETLTTDGAYLQEASPYLLTTVCSVGIEGMRALKAALPNTQVLGVTVLTNLSDDDTDRMFSCTVSEGVLRFARLAEDANIAGLISSPQEAAMLREEFGTFFSINTPAIRPAWSVVAGDDQNPARVMTPAKAITAGADRIVIGRPITKASDPREAVLRTLEEITAVND